MPNGMTFILILLTFLFWMAKIILVHPTVYTFLNLFVSLAYIRKSVTVIIVLSHILERDDRFLTIEITIMKT